uniref:DNA polymerase epsilon subunit n=1 Tax=Timema monikensis TaxID=170555 RepID=A0A7R9HPS4_9NEOP|nr:unnamed protein product [Timema monikensis]
MASEAYILFMEQLDLESDAQNLLVEQLRPIEAREREEWLDKLTDYVQKQSLISSVIEKEHIETAIQKCLRKGLDETETIFNVINTFNVPRFTFNIETKKFTKVCNTSPQQLFAPPRAKAFLFRDRYTILHQRTARHELFTPTIMGTDRDNSNRKFKLRPVEFLLSSSGRLNEVIVLGLLTQLREGRYFLEDPSGIVQLDMYHTGLHCENCFVLAEGWYEDKIFHIQGVGFPPPEPSKSSRAYYGNANTFGGPSIVSLKSSTKLLQHEKGNEDSMIVFLADVWLDHFKVMEKLRQLFQGYSEFPPVAFVLMGNFLSSQHGSFHSSLLKTHLRALADLILQFPEIVDKSKFVLIPGPTDPASPNILPRPTIPRHITSEFLDKIPGAVFGSNPCRLQYCTQEIVVLREDMVTKMCRNTIHFPEAGEIADHCRVSDASLHIRSKRDAQPTVLIGQESAPKPPTPVKDHTCKPQFTKTILCQAHLAPLPLAVCPIYWAHDTAMQLYPLPDLVVVADQFNAFTASYMDCIVTNPVRKVLFFFISRNTPFTL